MKTCSRCKRSKPLDEFHLNRNNRTDGRAGKCKPCCAEYSREWQQADPERARESWRRAERKSRNPIRKKAAQYGLSEDEVVELLATPACGICTRPFQDEGERHIDHDHDTGKVRGVLCVNCNTGIGNLRDSIELLQRAIEYLDGPLV